MLSVDEQKMQLIGWFPLVILLGLLAIQRPAVAQAQASRDVPGAAEIGHVTDVLNDTDEARRARASFHEARRLGLHVRHKTAIEYEIGARRSFFVHDMASSGADRQAETFELRSQSPLARIWVEVEALTSVEQDALDALITALTESTPEGSYDPGQGIIANNNAVFGDPPNVAGDPSPIVDVLLYDIREADGGPTIGGYVWSGDMCTNANQGLLHCNPARSNQADVLYLDSNELLNRDRFPLEVLLEVAAHEYQHLIHYGYDRAEETFVNEGLSEWAERLNGYRARSITYLSSEDERNISLFSWRAGNDVLKDYQRAGLFTTYLAERLGPELVGGITRRPESGTTGYRAALEDAGVLLEDLIADFHTTNIVNDRAVGDGGSFGYANPYLQIVQAMVDSSRVVDGRDEEATPPTDVTVHGGGSVYLRWEHVSDFSLHLTLLDGAPFEFLSTGVRVVLEDYAGTRAVETISLANGGTTVDFPGEHAALTLVASHTRPTSSQTIGLPTDQLSYHYSATWTSVTPSTSSERLDHPVAIRLDQNYPNPFNPSTAIRFSVAHPQQVRVGVYDMMGRQVETLFSGPVSAGIHVVHFDGSTHPSGLYVYVLETEQERLSRRMLLVR